MKYFEKIDNIMADWGFLIPDYLENIRVSLIYQFSLNGCEQLTKAEVKESQAIALVRIYQVTNTTYTS